MTTDLQISAALRRLVGLGVEVGHDELRHKVGQVEVARAHDRRELLAVAWRQQQPGWDAEQPFVLGHSHLLAPL